MQKCPDCGRSLTVPGRSNATATLDVPIALLPALERALAIGRNTAMMSDGQEVQDMTEKLRAGIKETLPRVAEIFSVYHWARLLERASQGRRLEITLSSDNRYFSPEYWIAITDGEDEPWGERSGGAVLLSNKSTNRSEMETYLSELRSEIERVSPIDKY